MNGNPEMIHELNLRLIEKHTNYVQYIAHSLMCKNSGYGKLAESVKQRALQEMTQMEQIIERVLFLDGKPNLSELNQVDIATDVRSMFLCDKETELRSIGGFSEAIDFATQHKDFGTRALLENLLVNEDKHLSEIEINMRQITEIGIENYLALQV